MGNYVSVEGGVASTGGKRVRLTQNANVATAAVGAGRTDGDFDRYVYLREDGTGLWIQAMPPNYEEFKGWVHPFTKLRCLLKTRVRVTQSGRTVAFITDYNHYPWQRFNSEAKVSPVKSIKILPNSSSPILRHNFDNESDVSIVFISSGTESRGNTVSAKRYSINFETGLYRDRPSVVLGQSTYGNQIDNRSDIKFLQDDTGITLLAFWSSTGDLHHINETGEIDVTFNRIGDDARQVELDNRYSG